MLRINLLPREIIEKRRYEKWYQWVFIGFGALIVFVLLVYAYLLLTAQAKSSEVQQLQEQKAKYQAQADAYSIFEKKEQSLAQREAIVQTALANRINPGQIANEVSLVLPDEVWLNSMTVSEADGLSLNGYTPQSPSESMDVGYKSVAKTLVRLNELPNLSDVWLASAANAQYAGFAPTNGATPKPANVVSFQASAKVVHPSPAPPSTPGK